MIILKPIATQQIIKFIKRPFGANPSNANVDFNLVDEITGEKMITATERNYFRGLY